MDKNEGETAAAPYQVLARKYRPQRFEDLIGHEAMVRTLKNAFASDRIAHAYILTGVRGVGKTTTARILARALNYLGPDGEDGGPKMDMAAEGRHCQAIAESRHPDVLEMDAASRTGVGDIRELIEGVRYAPVEARYKVYIIDEVHMLSTAAFNALLKTLEEPPPHVKFIFATTEIRKVPVTVLSRCQRFDLKRIDPETLTGHLAAIAEKEGVAVARDGLFMIARAAEGSVRDALSILDQAIVQHKSADGPNAETGAEIDAEAVRDMLGLADRTLVWDLLGACLKGDAKTALDAFAGQYDAGAEPAVILRDMLDIVHLLTRVKAAGPSAAAHGPAGEADAARAKEMADGLELNALTRAWSLLMKGLAETNAAPDASAAGEMALIRLCFAADLPTPDEALKALKKNSNAGERTVSAPTARGPAPVESVPPSESSAEIINIEPPLRQAPAAEDASLNGFEDVVRLAGRMRDAKLRTELEAFVHILSFEDGRIDMRLGEGAPETLPGRLTQRLKQWTGRQWLVSVSEVEGGAAPIRDQRLAEVMADPLVKKALEIFPGAEVTKVSEAEAPIDPAPDELEEDPPIDPDDEEIAALREQWHEKRKQ
jgi:DNA polymerase-3 subunit gamma/tau